PHAAPLRRRCTRVSTPSRARPKESRGAFRASRGTCRCSARFASRESAAARMVRRLSHLRLTTPHVTANGVDSPIARTLASSAYAGAHTLVAIEWRLDTEDRWPVSSTRAFEIKGLSFPRRARLA